MITQNLTVDQGSTFIANIIHMDSNKNPIDITAFSARSQMRRSYYSANAIQFSCNITDGANGKITMSLSPGQTANIAGQRYLYDLEIFNSTDVYKVSEGIITVNPEVTR